MELQIWLALLGGVAVVVLAVVLVMLVRRRRRSDLGSAVTGEIHYVDSGYNIMAMPRLDELKAAEAREEDEPEAAE